MLPNRRIFYLFLLSSLLAASTSCSKSRPPAASVQAVPAEPSSAVAVTSLKAALKPPSSVQPAAAVSAGPYTPQVRLPELAPKTVQPTAPPTPAAAVPALPQFTEGNLAWQPQVRMQKYDVTPYVVALSSSRSIDPLTAIPNAASQPYQTTSTQIAGVVQADLEPGAEDGVDVSVLPKESSLNRTFSPGDTVVTWTWLVAFKPTMTRGDIALYLTISSIGPDGKPVPLAAPQQVKVHLVSSPKLAAELVEQDLLPTIWNSVNNWVGATVTLLLGALGAWIARKLKQKPASKRAKAST